MSMKQALLFLLVTTLLVAMICGCAPAGQGNPATTESSTEATTEATTLPPAPEDLTYAAVTPYSTVMLPGYWQDCAIVEQTSGGDNAVHSLRFYEKTSRPTCGGHVFSLWLLPADADYTYLPQYQLLGTLTDNRGTLLKLIAVYPSDVQFEVDALEIYTKMGGEEERILATFTPAAGYTFTPTAGCNLFS